MGRGHMSIDTRELIEEIPAHHGKPQGGSEIEGVVGEAQILLDTLCRDLA